MSEHIKREDALNELIDRHIRHGELPIGVVRKAINAIPAADVVEVVHAKWEKVYEYTTFGAMYRCSGCGETIFNPETHKYCHRCGARMDGDAHD